MLAGWDNQSGEEHRRKQLPVGGQVAIQRRTAGAAALEGRADEIQVRYLGPIRDEAWLGIGDHRRTDPIPEAERVSDVAAAADVPLLTRVGDHEVAYAIGRVVCEAKAVRDVAEAVGGNRAYRALRQTGGPKAVERAGRIAAIRGTIDGNRIQGAFGRVPTQQRGIIAPKVGARAVQRIKILRVAAATEGYGRGREYLQRAIHQQIGLPFQPGTEGGQIEQSKCARIAGGIKQLETITCH